MVIHRSLTPAAVLALALVGCGHTDPFGAPPPPADSPLTPGSPARLTFSPFNDLAPRWAADGSGIYYTFGQGPRAGGDRCLGLLPPSGGTRVEVCHHEFGAIATIETFSSAATTADGRLAYMFSQASRVSVVAIRAEIREARVDAPLDFRTVQAFPTQINGTRVDAASHIDWVDNGTVIFLAERVTYVDTLAFTTGLFAVTLDLDGGAPPQVVAGTEDAASLALVASGTGVYFTRSEDNRILMVPLTGGTPSEVYAFGTGVGIDIAASGSRLVAAVDGTLRLVDLEAGTDRLVPGSSALGWSFQRPSISPDGRIAAQGLIPARTPGYDIYLFESP